MVEMDISTLSLPRRTTLGLGHAQDINSPFLPFQRTQLSLMALSTDEDQSCKYALINQYAKEKFMHTQGLSVEESYRVNFARLGFRSKSLDEEICDVKIFDMAGVQRFDSTTTQSLRNIRNIDGIVVVCDATNESSGKHAAAWLLSLHQSNELQQLPPIKLISHDQLRRRSSHDEEIISQDDHVDKNFPEMETKDTWRQLNDFFELALDNNRRRSSFRSSVTSMSFKLSPRRHSENGLLLTEKKKKRSCKC